MGCVGGLVGVDTIVDPENWVVRILQETLSGGGYTFSPSSDGRVVDKLVHYDRSATSTHVDGACHVTPPSIGAYAGAAD